MVSLSISSESTSDDNGDGHTVGPAWYYEGESGLRGKCIEIKEKCTSRVPSNETEDSFFLGREYVNTGFPETPPRTTSNLMGCLLTASCPFRSEAELVPGGSFPYALICNGNWWIIKLCFMLLCINFKLSYRTREKRRAQQQGRRPPMHNKSSSFQWPSIVMWIYMVDMDMMPKKTVLLYYYHRPVTAEAVASSGKSNEETKSIQFWNINSHCDDSGASSSSNSGRAFWHITIGHIN